MKKAKAKTRKDEDERQDPWGTDTGLASQFNGWIKDPSFGFIEEYQGGDALLFTAMLVDEEGEDVRTIGYSIGRDWEANDDGSEVEHPTKTRFIKSTRYGGFIERAKELGADEVLAQRGPPTEAVVWEGLGFYWDNESLPTVGGENKDTLMPKKFLGEVEEDEDEQPKARKKKKKVVEEEPEDEDEDEDEEEIDLDPKLQKKLLKLAKGGSKAAFIRKAARIPEVTDLPEALVAHVLGSGKEGFYEQNS